MTAERLTYLRAGHADYGLAVHVERSRNQLLTGTVVSIADAPAHAPGRARRCTMRVNVVRRLQVYEDRLLVGPGR